MEKGAAKSTGTLNISSSVIVKIVEQAAIEIKGIASDGKKLAVSETAIGLTKRFRSPVKVRLTKEAAEIDITVIVEQGNKAIAVASELQESIKSAVQSMAGIPVSKVNVNIAGYRINKE